MSDVIRRRNLQIVEAIEGDAIKQALSLSSKRIKKGEKGDSLLAVRAWALAESPNTVHNGESLAEVEKLIHKEPAVLDLDTLLYLQKALDALRGGAPALVDQGKASAYLQKIWANALKAQPQDENLNREIFFLAFTAREWKISQQAAMNLQKHSSNRLYHFWAIYSCHMLAVNSPLENERTLFSTLALRMISKAAEAAVPDREGLTSPKAIQTVEELKLLLSIYTRRQMFAEIEAICKHEQLGLSSPLARGDWMVVNTYLQALLEQGKWPILHNECLKLFNGEYGFDGDDWKVWQFLLKATSSSSDISLLSETEQTIEAFSLKRSRNAKLAKLELYMESGSLQSFGSTSTKVEECYAYFLSEASKPSCFDDLTSSISTFDDEQIASFVKRLEVSPQVNPAADAAKHALLYYLEVSRLSIARSADLTDKLISACITSYAEFVKSSKALATYETDAAEANLVLAAMALSLGSNDDPSPSASQLDILRAAVLLEYSLTILPNHYQVTLLLLLIWRHLGSASKLFYSFPRLNVKNMQFESMSHYLLTRIATFHPSVAPSASDLDLSKEQRDPMAFVSNVLGTYGRPRQKIDGHVKLSLQSGNYSNIQSFHELQDAYSSSIVRALNILEERRIIRFTYTKKGSTDPRLLDIWDHIPPNLVDKRDFKSMANYEHKTQPPFIELFNKSPTPGKLYVEAYELVELLFLTLNLGPEAVQNRFPPILATKVPTALQELEKKSGWEKEFTSAEKEYILLARPVAEAFLYIQSGPAAKLDKPELEAGFTKILEKIPPGKSSDLSDAFQNLAISKDTVINGSFIQTCFTYLECTLLLSAFTDALSSLPKGTRAALPSLSPIKEATSKLRESVRAAASRYRNDLSESGVVGTLVDRVLGRDADGGGRNAEIGSAIEAFVDEGHIEITLGSIVESWIDACDGILKVT